MYVYFSFPSVHRRRRIFISTLISHQPTVPPADCLCSCPHRCDTKIILALTPQWLTQQLYVCSMHFIRRKTSMYTEKYSRILTNAKTRKKCFSSDYTNTDRLDDVFRIIFAHCHILIELWHELQHVTSSTAAFGGFTTLRHYTISNGVYNTQWRTQHKMHCYCCFGIRAAHTNKLTRESVFIVSLTFVRRGFCLCSKALYFFIFCP